MLQIICTDFDGTIFDSKDQPPVAAEFVARLGEAQRRGVAWVINTGRTQGDVEAILQGLALGITPDFIVSVERQIHRKVAHGYEGLEPWNSVCGVDHEALFAVAFPSVKRMRHRISSQVDAHLYEDVWSPLCVIARSMSDADLIHGWLEEECGRIEGLTVVRNAEYFRLAHAAYSKGTALAELSRQLKVASGRIFAAGDHFNDLPMLAGDVAGCVAAPSNAIPEVQRAVVAAGGFVASRPCSRGVLEALEHFQSRS